MPPFARVLAPALVCVACGPSLPFEPAGPNSAPNPAVMGPYPVGVRTVTILDGSRLDPRTREPRPLVTEIWYPATESSRGKPGASYGVEDILPPEIIPDGATDTRVTSVAVRDAAIYDGNDEFPLVIFSHGSGSLRLQSTFFTVVLASHGYIVAAPDHLGNTLPDLLADGSLDESALLNAFDDRPPDVSKVIDWVTSPPDDDPLAGRVDSENIGVAGHSFGAITAIRVLGSDDRVDVSVAHTPAGFLLTWGGNERELNKIGVPIMIQVAGVDGVLPPEEHAAPLWANMGSPRYRVTLKTAGHFTFSDLCELADDAIEAAASIGIDAARLIGDGCAEDNVPVDVALPVINHYSIGLINGMLRDSPGSLDLLNQAKATELAGDEVEYIQDL